MNKKALQQELKDIEQAMLAVDFWRNKEEAQSTIARMQEIKDALQGLAKYDKGNAIINIFAGAGGDDAEDFVRMLFEMYQSWATNEGYLLALLSISKNDLNGFRSISFEVQGTFVYKKLKHETGVHRLVRKSPFNSKGKRQTSFALVEVLPQVEKNDFEFDESELEISFARSGGAGGQNVNRRETAVRIVHPKTGFSVFISEERTQERNKERALEIMRAKLLQKHLEDEEKKEQGRTVSDKVNIEWGSQMRSYVLDPYQLVKDHDKDIEFSDVEKVLAGHLTPFIKR